MSQKTIKSAAADAERFAARELEKYIQAMGLGEGDRLPPERDLSATLDVSRRTLRKVLADLELEGRVWRGRRNGTLLGNRPAAITVSVDVSMAQSSPAEIMECRLIVEPPMAARAAIHASAPDIVSIKKCVLRTSEITDDADWIKWDGAFHSAIARASRNTVLESLVQAFNHARAQPDWNAAHIATSAGSRQEDVANHRRIADAIAARDSLSASQAMRDHLTTVRDQLGELFS